MGETITRHAHAADTAAITDLARACGLPEPDLAAIGEHVLCAVAADGAVIGCAWIMLDASMRHERRACLAGMVHPHCQRQGIGTRLLAWQTGQAKALLHAPDDQRPAVLRIDFFHEQQGALALYKRYGFAQVQRLVTYRKPVS